MYFVISMFSFYEDYEQDIFLMVPLLPLLILGLLDAFYLQQQRLRSSLFNHVSVLDDDKVDFYMTPYLWSFELSRRCEAISISDSLVFIKMASIATYARHRMAASSLMLIKQVPAAARLPGYIRITAAWGKMSGAFYYAVMPPVWSKALWPVAAFEDGGCL